MRPVFTTALVVLSHSVRHRDRAAWGGAPAHRAVRVALRDFSALAASHLLNRDRPPRLDGGSVVDSIPALRVVHEDRRRLYSAAIWPSTVRAAFADASGRPAVARGRVGRFGC